MIINGLRKKTFKSSGPRIRKNVQKKKELNILSGKFNEMNIDEHQCVLKIKQEHISKYIILKSLVYFALYVIKLRSTSQAKDFCWRAGSSQRVKKQNVMLKDCSNI